MQATTHAHCVLHYSRLFKVTRTATQEARDTRASEYKKGEQPAFAHKSRSSRRSYAGRHSTLRSLLHGGATLDVPLRFAVKSPSGFVEDELSLPLLPLHVVVSHLL